MRRSGLNMCDISEFTDIRNDSACDFIVPDWKKNWTYEKWIDLPYEKKQNILNDLNEEIVRNQMEIADCQKKLDDLLSKKEKILNFSIDN